jgi:hypothetical protein
MAAIIYLKTQPGSTYHRDFSPESAHLKGSMKELQLDSMNVFPEKPLSETGGPARLLARVAGRCEIEIVYVQEKNILYWADQSSQGRTKISCTATMSPTNQPRKDPLH